MVSSWKFWDLKMGRQLGEDIPSLNIKRSERFSVGVTVFILNTSRYAVLVELFQQIIRIG